MLLCRCNSVGTLLQPKMNKRKSVSKMTEKDAKDATKYVLTHQTVDSEGDLETNLVKVTVKILTLWYYCTLVYNIFIYS